MPGGINQGAVKGFEIVGWGEGGRGIGDDRDEE